MKPKVHFIQVLQVLICIYEFGYPDRRKFLNIKDQANKQSTNALEKKMLKIPWQTRCILFYPMG